jgi:hypothetical protein
MPDLYKKRILSYSNVKEEQTIIINPSKGKIVSDEKGHSGQNIKFLGQVVQATIQDYVYLNEKCWIIFPRITFQTMLFNYFKTRNDLEEFLGRDFDHEIIFMKKNKKKYVVKSIKPTEEFKLAQHNDII